MSRPVSTHAKQSIGGMEVLAHLSTGGMGSVLLALRKGALGFEKLVAVKTIRVDIAQRHDVRGMFLDEARLLARLEHPTVAQVYDFGEESGTLYLAMEYVAGITFAELIKRYHVMLAPIICARLMIEVCHGLHAAHQLTDLAGHPLGVVHRDISPQNLSLAFDGRVKILDFGIALMRDREAPVTQVGFVKGKLSYMAPEQLAGLTVDRRTDIYAASVVLYELISGTRLFDKSVPVMDRVVPPLSEVVRSLPVGLEEVVSRGLQNDPDRRFGTAEEMSAALERVVAADNDSESSIAAFVERTLGDERESHRTRLRAMLGESELSRLAGQPMGRMTPTLLSSATTATLKDIPEQPASLQADAAKTSDLMPRRRRPLHVGLLLLAGGVLALVLYLGSRSTHHDSVAGPDARANSPVAATQPAASQPATSQPAEVSHDSGPGRTAARASLARNKTITKRPARRADRTAPLATKSEPEKSTTPQPKGYLTVGSRDYAMVVVDGVRRGLSPLIKQPLAAGEHEVMLLKPINGELLIKKVVRIAPGEHRYVTYP